MHTILADHIPFSLTYNSVFGVSQLQPSTPKGSTVGTVSLPSKLPNIDHDSQWNHSIGLKSDLFFQSFQHTRYLLVYLEILL